MNESKVFDINLDYLKIFLFNNFVVIIKIKIDKKKLRRLII